MTFNFISFIITFYSGMLCYHIIHTLFEYRRIEDEKTKNILTENRK